MLKPDLHRVLLIDDDADVLESARLILEAEKLPCCTLSDPNQVMEQPLKNWNGVVITDVRMPGMNGMALQEALRAFDEQLPVIMISGHGDIPMAVQAVRAGAYDFLEKPVQPDRLISCVRSALQIRSDVVENRLYLNRELSDRLLGDSAAISRLREGLIRLAQSTLPVLLIGESGTGKRTIAELLHRLGKASQGPIVQLDGELLPPVGADQDALALWRDRYWQAAAGGTLLIQHPEKLPQQLQTALFNWLLELDQRQSGNHPMRVITLSTHDLTQELSDGRLRPDLYYALAGASVTVPPLRQRKADIPQLFRHFVLQSCRRLRKPRPEVKKAFLDRLMLSDWPGNLRELRNIAELYAIGMAKLSDMPRALRVEDEARPLDEKIDDFERALIEDALMLFQGKINDAADYLHIPRKKLYLRMKKHSLTKEHFKYRRASSK